MNHNNETSLDALEVAKFAKLSLQWWDKDGSLKTLHDINPARLQYIHQYLEISGKRVLDVGCGGGILAEAMAIEGAEVTAVDASVQALIVAKQHALQSGLTVDYQHSLIEDFEAAPFDLITCMELLEHVHSPKLVIQHCNRLLKPGGFLLLSTINKTLKAYLTAIIAAEYILGILPRQTHDYEKFIRPSDLASLGRHQGLEMLGLCGLVYNPFNRQASLNSSSVAVNYLMAFQKPW